MKLSQKSFLTLILVILLVGPILATPKTSYAQNTDPVQAALQPAKWIWEKIEIAYDFLQKRIGSQVINNTVRTYVNNLAYNIASSIAQGAEDGKSLFRRESIKDSLQKSKEAALGEFIGSLSENSFADLGFNLCDPSVEIKLSLTLALIDSKAPPAPKCNWREVEKNWNQFSEQVRGGQWTDFIKLKLSAQGTAKDWEDFWSSFSVANSDLGVAQTLFEKMNEVEMTAADVAKMTAEECKGFKDISSPIAGQVKTHCMTVLEINEKQWDLIIDPEVQRLERLAKEDAVKLSDILKDAGQYFMKTLSSKMLKYALKWGQDQISALYANNNDFRNSLLDRLRGGADLSRPPRGADIFRDLLTVNFQEVESFSLLENFAICPDEADFRQPDNCVITTELLQAIGEKKTVAQLISDGQLDPGTVFISPSDPANNSDTCYRDGFCYHNLVKLRKANVIPVGWEMAATLSPAGQAVTLGELVACFEDQDGCPYSGTPHNPYYHLVDPDWVLKIPPARCEALVYAPTLESKESSARQEYCADVTTCLREDDEGNCLDGQYGYCTRSENIWRLDAERCEDGEVYSGCLTFAGLDGNASYLEQTLDYCNADAVGCERYSQEKDANNSWILEDINTDDNDIFLNDKASDCPSEQAGCHEYIVMAAGRGVNLLPNGSFEYDAAGWSSPNIQIVSDAYLAAKAANFQDSLNTTFYSGVPLKERKFIFSFYGKDNSPSSYDLVVRVGTEILFTQNFSLTPIWQNNSFTINFPADTEDTAFSLQLLGDNGIIDAAKLEEVGQNQTLASSFSTYGDGARIFMNDDRQMCLAEEVGCQGYIPANGDPMIPGVIASGDLCPSECVGYASFAQSPNIFDVMEGDDLTEYYNLIPDTAVACPASAVGCEEFTNLDLVAEGGEGKEYYSYLRQCVPNTSDNIETYYTWEGQDVAGYQLKTWTFLKSDVTEANGGQAPCTNVEPGTNNCTDSDDLSLVAYCGADTPDPSDDPDVNPNCREFFDTDGQSFYRLEDRVVYASAECQPFRRAVSGQEYQAIASLSYSCQAQYAGCRWYAGETANNVRQIMLDTFENGSYSPWEGSGLDLSNESLANGGHSLKANVGADLSRFVAGLQNEKAYQLSWWMKSTGNISNVRVILDDGDNEYQIGTLEAIGSNSWRNYQVSSANILNFTELDNIFLRLEFDGAGEVFLDNILLKEVVDNLSLVKNSWSTPASCDMPFTGAYLGCQAYTDTNGTNYSLKSFNSLCREESIGCMAAIDTHNSTNPFAETFHASLVSEVTVPADNLVYLVPEVENYCPQAYKGCSALGLPQIDQATENIDTYSTMYKLNNPDNYDQSLCTADNLYCQAYNSAKGTYYFRDPGTKTCSYEKNRNVDGTIWTGWFKTSSLETATVIGCSDNGNGILEALDLELNLVDNWAASCPEDKNLCTTFSDPLDNDKPYYYYNNNQIDKTSCNGQFDQNSGCILLRDENNWNGAHTNLINQYNAVDSLTENIASDRPIAPVTNGNLDSNVLVKVRKDRQCAEWLSCKSSTAVFDESTNAYKIICEAIDSCTAFNTTSNISQCAQWSTYTDDTLLNIDQYQNRATSPTDHLSWSDKEYLGYSIPGSLPVKDLVSYNFATTTGLTDLRLVYPTEVECAPDAKEAPLATCDFDLDGNGAINGDEADIGICKDRVCWLNPKADDQIVSLMTRAYATQDAPFANRILNSSKETATQAFSQANICQDGSNACEPGYKKVTYGNGGFIKYLGGNTDTEAIGSVCTIVGEGDGRVVGDSCDNNVDCGGPGGRCSAPSKIETYLNWQGLCLESDPSTSIPMDDINGQNVKNYCNQWYPVEQIQGAQSLYNNFVAAGFYNESSGNSLEMCTVAQEFVTTEDRYYCGATENGFGDGSGFSCTVLLKVPANSKVNINRAGSFSTFIQGNYLLASTFNFNSDVQGVIRNASSATCGGENFDNRDRRECINDGAFFTASDFDASTFANVIIDPDELSALFDGAAGQIEYFYFDEAVLGDGTWNLDEGANGGDNDKILAAGALVFSDGDSCNDWDVAVCPNNFHQVEVRDWRGNSHCGVYGQRKQYGKRYCNPLSYNYYIKADAPNNNASICTETSCAEPTYGETCLQTKPTYSSITIPSQGCGTNLNCQYKNCVINLNVINNYCSEYGQVVYDEAGAPTDITGCLDIILEVQGSQVILEGGVNASLVTEVQNCLTSEIDTACSPGTYQVEKTSANCSGAEGEGACLQQCQTISQIGAEGDHDKSWVRTDVWWRSGENPTFNKGWQAWYYNNLSYARNNQVYLEQAGSVNINKYFGSAHGSMADEIVLTKTPLDTNENPNETAIFFGQDLATAQAQMKFLFARLYNLTWNPANTSYPTTEAEVDRVVIDDAANVNPDAGPDYAPVVYKICANKLCDDVGQGITVNNQNGQNVVGRRALDADLRLYYHAHPDHMPIVNIHVDWGDGFTGGDMTGSYTQKYKNSMPAKYCDPNQTAPTGVGLMGFAGTINACQPGYKVFYHPYTYPADETAAAPYLCNGNGGRPNIEGAVCYRPSVTVTDNWEWTTPKEYGAWVVVYRE